MDRPRYAPVVDQMVSELAARRQVQAAYVALARAIVAGEGAEGSEQEASLSAA